MADNPNPNRLLSCRTCLTENVSLKPIFSEEETNKKSYAKMIMALTPVNITETDKYPLDICENCVKKLRGAYEFHQQCIEVDSCLKRKFEQYKKEFREEEFRDETELLEFNNQNSNGPPDVEKEEKSDIDDENTNYSDTNFDDDMKSESNDETTPKLVIKLKKVRKKQEKNHQCPLCPIKYVTKYKLSCHMLVHTKEKPFICDICGKKFPSNGNLKRHIKAHNDERAFACTQCDKRFCQKTTLIEHTRTHTGEKPYKCNLCDKSYKTSSSLRQHKLGASHGNVRPQITKKSEQRYECQQCDKDYATKNGLYQHSLRHRGKKLICSFCRKEFVSYAGLQQHKKAQHSEDHKFQCNQCGKIFKYQVVFKTHMLIHTGVKPYKCQFCPRMFTQKGHVVSHERLHTGVKPFQCEFCDKFFRHLTTLRDHRRTHTGEMPYKCNICQKGFCNLSYFRKHGLSHNCIRNTIVKEENGGTTTDVVKNE